MPPTSLRVKVRCPYGGQQGSRPSGPSSPLMSPTASSSPAPLMPGTIPSQNFSTLMPTPGALFQTRCLPGFFHSCHPLHEDFLDHCSWRSLRWVQGTTRRTHRTQKSSCTHDFGFLQQSKKTHGAKSRRDQARAFSCLLPEGSYRQHLLCPATMCDNTYRGLPIRKVHLSLGVYVFYWGSVT